MVIVVALVLALGSGSGKNNAAQSGSATTPAQSHSASPSVQPTPTVGPLKLGQFQAGDCLTGANLQLNKNTPWPALSTAVPCSQGHTAEVFYVSDSFWAKDIAYPGDDGIKEAARTGCNTAFQSYVGIDYSRSIYTWTFIVPDAKTWPRADRSLYCIAYYPSNPQPAGQIMHGSIKGTAR